MKLQDSTTVRSKAVHKTVSVRENKEMNPFVLQVFVRLSFPRRQDHGKPNVRRSHDQKEHAELTLNEALCCGDNSYR